MESTELIQLVDRKFEATISGMDDYFLHKVLLTIKRERPGAWPSPQPGEAERTGTPPYPLGDL